MRAILASLCCGGLVLVGCASPVTRLIVVVESDRAVPAELDRVLVRTQRDRSNVDAHTFDVETAADVPFSLVVVPREGAPEDGAITIVAEGWSAAGIVASHSVATGFVARETRLVRLRLDRCPQAPCERMDVIAPEDLPPVIPGREFERDAGASDASRDDAGMNEDGGPTDGGGKVDAATRAPTSCADHLERGAVVDGVYSIDPDDDVSTPPIDVFCEMQDDGGGWTLLLKADGFTTAPAGPSQLAYDSPHWTQPERLNPTSLSRDRTEAVLDAYHEQRVREIRIEMWETTSRTRREVFSGLPLQPLAATIRNGSTVTLGDVGAWGRLVDQNLGALACAESGINVQMASAVRVRIGAIGSVATTCSPAAGWIGVGASVTAQPNCDVTMNTAGGGRLCGPPGQRRSWERFAIVFGR